MAIENSVHSATFTLNNQFQCWRKKKESRRVCMNMNSCTSTKHDTQYKHVWYLWYDVYDICNIRACSKLVYYYYFLFTKLLLNEERRPQSAMNYCCKRFFYISAILLSWDRSSTTRCKYSISTYNASTIAVCNHRSMSSKWNSTSKFKLKLLYAMWIVKW